MLDFLKMRKSKPDADRSGWTDAQWMDHLLENATSQSERAEIQAIFHRAST